MSRKLFDAEAKEVEVPDETELETLRADAARVKDLEAKLAEAEEAANPNWKEARGKVKKYDKLRSNGVDIDDDGNIVNTKEEITMEKVRQESRNAAQREILDGQLARKIESLPENLRDSARAKFDKLTAGEKLDLDNLNTYFEEAVRIVAPGKSIAERSFAGSGGGAPIFTPKQKEEEQQGEELSSAFGLPTLKDFKK